MDCHFLLQGIFPTQGLNPCFPCLLHYRWILYLGAKSTGELAQIAPRAQRKQSPVLTASLCRICAALCLFCPPLLPFLLVYCLQPYWSYCFINLPGLVLPQDFCTGCFLCPESSSSNHPHGRAPSSHVFLKRHILKNICLQPPAYLQPHLPSLPTPHPLLICLHRPQPLDKLTSILSAFLVEGELEGRGFGVIFFTAVSLVSGADPRSVLNECSLSI